MLTDSTELVKWWGPQGFTIPAAELNLAEGGRYHFRMRPPDGEPFPKEMVVDRVALYRR